MNLKRFFRRLAPSPQYKPNPSPPVIEAEYLDESPQPLTSSLKSQSMTFYEAMVEIGKGNKITRLEWGDKEFYGLMKDEILQLHKPGNRYNTWIISLGDVESDDWMVL